MLNPRDDDFIYAFGQRLVATGLLDETALKRATSAQNQTSERFDFVLTRLGLLSEEDLVQSLADHIEWPRYRHEMLPTSTPIGADILPIQFMRINSLIPLFVDDHTLKLAVADPFNSDTLAAISYKVDRNVNCTLASSQEIQRAFEILYPEVEQDLPSSDDVSKNGAVSESDLQRLRDLATEAPVVQLINQTLAKAIDSGASDIHIECWEDRLVIRHRNDGVLTIVQEVPLTMQPAIITRIKILAYLNIAEQRLPQDGRIKHNIRGREIDLRVSTVPTINGETIVLRILDRGRILLEFDAIGLQGQQFADYHSLLTEPNGIILATGPTGSGKTTTLYTSLQALNREDRKILTIEDPIEYQLKGVNQIQVKPDINLTFAVALRSILRQDPDIIMIGEIRDHETAQIAVQAALTGHLVLATLHTNDAASSITRLRDMGVESYLLASTIIGVVAQRLVRKLCTYCREPQSAADFTRRLANIDDSFKENEQTSVIGNPHIAKGCNECRNTGYAGRTMILELLKMNDAMRQLVSSDCSANDIERAAISSGMETIKRQGIQKVLNGETTIEEVLRVTRST